MLTLTLTSHLRQNVGLGEGLVGSFPELYNDSLTLPLPTNPTLVLDLVFEFYNDMKCSGKIGLIKTLRTVFFFNVLSTYKKSLMFVNLIINLVLFF